MTDAKTKCLKELVAVLGAILQMSDDVKHAASPLDMQGKLLRLQNSIQKNGSRLTPLIQKALKEIGEI